MNHQPSGSKGKVLTDLATALCLKIVSVQFYSVFCFVFLLKSTPGNLHQHKRNYMPYTRESFNSVVSFSFQIFVPQRQGRRPPHSMSSQHFIGMNISCFSITTQSHAQSALTHQTPTHDTKHYKGFSVIANVGIDPLLWTCSV